eukprot:CAMPEP_0176439978 /NCGR_PEP_ID=MMETSP0127-20121128/20286_1 /TAXON_ID=938130 /ORGANISM="Platyophrya macrostoma, Strain WH" /LENGTH=114 /DNA_ID=CAMNT_0017824393 /DNA_START=42 /DNA_END=382 /DNA_ORIENTATION=+
MSRTILAIITLQIIFLGASCQLLGGEKTQNTTITPHLKALMNSGLKQVNDIGGNYTIQNTNEVILMVYTTQVVSGTLSRMLMEVRDSSVSKLVSTELWDEPWTGKIHKLTKACT